MVALQARATYLPDAIGTSWVQMASTKIRIPDEYELSEPESIEKTAEHHTLTLYARSFSQGEVIYAEIRPNAENTTEQSPASAAEPDTEIQPDIARLTFAGRQVPLTRTGYGYRGFIPVSPNSNPGNIETSLDVRTEGRRSQLQFHIEIHDANFPEFRRALDLGEHSNTSQVRRPEVIQQIEHGNRKKAETFALRTEDKFTPFLSHPRNMHHITSPFFIRRVYEQYRIVNGQRVNEQPRVNVHRGVDLRGATGSSVYAIADGTVVLAEKLYFEGNFTVIDHGNGIFSGYMHQHQLHVKEGQQVRAGDKIGEVGATGAVTGAHLHLSLWIRGIPLDALSLLHLPVQ